MRLDHSRNDRVSLVVFPNPANEIITIISDKIQEAFITNIHGQQIQKLLLVKGTQAFHISSWKPGVYYLKTADGVKMIIKK